MDNENNNKEIMGGVLEAIKAGRVRMRPKWHFVLKAILMALGGVIMLLALLYLASFIIFTSRQTGVWFTPSFGSRGWYEFATSLPWILIVLTLSFILVLEILVKRYAFAYKQPLLYSALGIIAIVFLGGIVLAQTSFHQQLFRYAEDNKLPFGSGFYKSFGLERMAKTELGTIIEVLDPDFMLEDRRGEILRVFIVKETRFPLGTDLREGDTVVVFGDRDGNAIHALGIRKVPVNFGPRAPHIKVRNFMDAPRMLNIHIPLPQ